MATESEKPALGVVGFLLFDQKAGRHFFRVYGERNGAGVRPHTDYAIESEDVAVRVEDARLVLIEGPGGNALRRKARKPRAAPGEEPGENRQE